jgi:RNA polymerase sigma factor (sigma-70 family)
MPPPPAELFASRIFLGPALRAQPDRRLVDLVRDGYDAAFEEIVRRYRKPLDRFAAAIVGGRSEDVTQDAFSKALLALRGSEAEIELRPWLYRIVRNTALNDLRGHAPTEEIPEALPGGRSTAAEAEAREELRDLMGRLQALPEPQRAALVMRELEGLSHEEIAAALGVSGGAARQAIYRARAALREGFGLLLPLPALRMFAEHGAEMVKAGAATVLIAGTVGAGVAIKHHQVGNGNSNVAEAAPLVGTKHSSTTQTGESASGSSSGASDSSRHGSADGKGDRHGNGSDSGSRFLGDGSRSGSGGPGPSSGSHSGRSSHHSGSSGPGPNSGSGDGGSGDHHGGSGSNDDGGGSSSGSGSNDDGGSGGSSGGGSSGGSGSGGSGSSGSGSGEIESESEPTSEPVLSESDDGGGSEIPDDDSSESSGSSSSGPGSGETTTNLGEPDVSP